MGGGLQYPGLGAWVSGLFAELRTGIRGVCGVTRRFKCMCAYSVLGITGFGLRGMGNSGFWIVVRR